MLQGCEEMNPGGEEGAGGKTVKYRVKLWPEDEGPISKQRYKVLRKLIIGMH